jgi:ATP synthase subunit 6
MNYIIYSPFEHFGLTSLLSNYTYINSLILIYIIIIYLCIILSIFIIDVITYNLIPLNAFNNINTNNIDMLLDFGLLISFPLIWITLLCHIFNIILSMLFNSIIINNDSLLEFNIVPSTINDIIFYTEIIEHHSNYHLVINLFNFSWLMEASMSELLMPLIVILITFIGVSYTNYFNSINNRYIESAFIFLTHENIIKLNHYYSLTPLKQIIKEFKIFVGKYGKKYTSYLFYLFCAILTFNIIGLTPYTLAITSHFFIPFSIAIVSWISIFLIGCHLYGIFYVELFIPKGVPLPIVPLLIVIELISYFFRMFSLSIRLFANILAGHVVIELITFAIYIMTISFDTSLSSIFIAFASFIPMIILIILINVEWFVAFLQAYIFTVLVSIYLGELTYPA